jgi:hypothetical protein
MPRITGLVRLRVVLEAKAGVLGHQLVQHVGHFLLVAALFRLHRQAEHRDRQLERPRVDVRVARRIVQDVVELDLVDLGDRADVAGHRFGHLDLRLAPEQVEVARLDRFAAFADVELRARRDAPLVDAEYREPADVGVDLDLEYMRERVQARIGHRSNLSRSFTPCRNVEVNGRVALGRVGQQLDDDIEQLGDAGAGARRREHHRIRWPSRIARSSGSCRSSGATSPFSR